VSEEISSLAEEVDACNLPYSMELVRLVDGVSTYELCINGEVREFGDLDDLYEHVRIAKANAKAEVITKALAAARNAALEEAAKVADAHVAAMEKKLAKPGLSEFDEGLFESAHTEGSYIASAIRALKGEG
jgi:hypothetical protein